jgi:hypothetical protein
VTAPRWLAGAAVLLLAAGAAPAAAQGPASENDTPPRVRFLPRYAFHMNAEHLSGDDPRLVWEAHYGGELDVVDYGAGRFTFAADYHVVLGEQIRIFDPNQGNYLLEGALSLRLRGAELAGVFHHTSRHLSDRPKTAAVDWNMMGVRLRAARAAGRLAVEGGTEVLGVIQSSTVDYSWAFGANTGVRYAATPRVGVVGRSAARVLGVDGRFDRGTQAGFRVEGGVDLRGEAGVVELFAAVERRVDPIPFEADTATWFALGFRLLSR